MFEIGTPVTPEVAARWFQALYESPLMFSGILDDHGRVLDANHLSVEGCGFRRDEVLGVAFWECGWWSPDAEIANQVRRWCEETLATGRPLRARSTYFLSDGRARVVDLALHPVAADGIVIDCNSPSGYIVATGSDITEAVAAQAEHEQRVAIEADVLRQANDLFRGALDAMIDHVAIGTSIRGPDGEITDFEIEFMNRASVDGAGRSADEIVGSRVCDLYPSWRASGMFDRFCAVVETGTPFVGYRVPYEDALDDGTPIAGYWDLQVTKLGDGYIAASRDVTEAVHDEVTLREAQQVAERERVAVELLQRAALPLELPVTRRATLGAHYQPAAGQTAIGGDWYDAFNLDDTHIALVIADVAGHGPDAAAYMVQIRNVMRTVAVEHRAPADILRRANNVARRLDETSVAMTTGCVAVLDLTTAELTWSLAGHPPPLLLGADGRTEFLAVPPGLPIGVWPGTEYPQAATRLQEGDRIVMFTDGLVERRDEPFDAGLARLVAIGHECRRLAPQAAAEWLVEALSPRLDDVALLVVEFGTAAPPTSAAARVRARSA